MAERTAFPDCGRCGRPYHRHNIGTLTTCPIIPTYVAPPTYTPDATPDRSDDALAEENRRLREALERIERVMRTNIHENDGPDRIWLDGVAHQGPLASWAIRCFRKVGEIARAALKGDGL